MKSHLEQTRARLFAPILLVCHEPCRCLTVAENWYWASSKAKKSTLGGGTGIKMVQAFDKPPGTVVMLVIFEKRSNNDVDIE